MTDDMRRTGSRSSTGGAGDAGGERRADGVRNAGSEMSLPVSGYPRGIRFSRARDYHLYTPEGRRYLDCILSGGAAVLGHTPPGLSQALKNRISAGPLVPAEGKEGGRLRLAVRRLFPGVVSARAISIDALSRDDFAGLPLWRPFERSLPGSGVTPDPPAERFLLVPSFPLDPRLVIYCSPESGEAAGPTAVVPASDAPREAAVPEDREPRRAAQAAAAPAPNPAGAEGAGLTAAAAGRAALGMAAAGATPAATGESPEGTLLASPPLSPVMVAGVTKAVHLLASAYEGESVPRKLATSESDGWKEPLATGDFWEARGVYYRYLGPENGYEELRVRLEEAGILIPTSPDLPLVIPRIIGGHERSLWDRIHGTL